MTATTSTPRRPRRQRLRASVALVVVLASGCRDASTAPDAGKLNLGVQTSGGDIDIDGYEFIVDSLVPRYIGTSGVAIDPDGTQRVELPVLQIKPGTHLVSLKNVADNCTVRDANPRSVTIAAGEVANVDFSVLCAATGIAITTRTTGVDQPSAYDLRVDGMSRPVPPNDSQVVSRLEPGPHTISLQAFPENCSLAGGAQTVTVAIRSITPVHFEISCSPIVRLEKIAYVFDSMAVGGATQTVVGLINPDGSGASVLGAGDAPSWSPDGRKLVFTEAICSYYDPYYGVSCAGELVVVDPEMRSRTSMAGGSGAFGPAWSPTGDLIAFTRCCTNGDANRIYLVRSDGSQSDQLTVSQVVSVSNPGWSPDGKRIAFTCSSDGSSTDLCVIDRTGNGFARLTTDMRVAGGRPAWRPDGTSIAFSAYSHRQPVIFLLDVATGAVTRVTGGSQPAWSRDGSQLAISGVGIPGLYTVTADGYYVATLRIGAYGEPAWRP